MFALIPMILGCNKEEVERLTKSSQEQREKIRSLEKDLQVARRSEQSLRFLASKMNNVKARIKTNCGGIELKFFPEKAPIHCFNFISRTESGFYDNTQFHRVIPKFMIQGGDPNNERQKFIYA